MEKRMAYRIEDYDEEDCSRILFSLEDNDDMDSRGLEAYKFLVDMHRQGGQWYIPGDKEKELVEGLDNLFDEGLVDKSEVSYKEDGAYSDQGGINVNTRRQMSQV